MRSLLPLVFSLLCLVAAVVPCSAQTEGQLAHKRFEEWKRQPANADLSFGQALTNYRKQLVAEGASDAAADRWDLIAIIYALEKRSARRVRDALKPGGRVVIEAGIIDEPESPMGYRPGELRSLFEGFQIVKYEETTGKYDWGPETIRLVRLVAVKK